MKSPRKSLEAATLGPVTAVPSDSQPLWSELCREEDLAEILELFVQELSERVGVLRKGLETRDWAGLARMAHQLEGAAGSYGFAPIGLGAARVEQAIRHRLPESQIRQAVEGLIGLCRRAHAGVPPQGLPCVIREGPREGTREG